MRHAHGTYIIAIKVTKYTTQLLQWVGIAYSAVAMLATVSQIKLALVW